jgi:hypothetical protein
MKWKSAMVVGCASTLMSGPASAHFFAQPYVLPVPYEIYAYGAAASLAASFLLLAFFVSTTSPKRKIGKAETRRADEQVVKSPRAAGLVLMIVCVVAGLFGTQNPYMNICMTMFWIWFVLGVPYAVAFAGNIYARYDPMRAIVELAEGPSRLLSVERVRYPAWLGCYPASLFYGIFVWLELFGHLSPRGLATSLIAYGAVTVFGSYLFGQRVWLRRCEFFALTMRVIGSIALIEFCRGACGRSCNVHRPVKTFDHISQLFFVTCLLSSTTFDGLHATTPWVNSFWQGIYPLIPTAIAGANEERFVIAVHLYNTWQYSSLLVLPFVYFGIFLGFCRVMKWMTRSNESSTSIAIAMTPSLVPIALAYHIAHYFTVFLSQGVQITREVSDPLGYGWNLFGTARFTLPAMMLDMGTVWHTQVGVIVIGHAVGLYVAHRDALTLFNSRKSVVASQLPMLGLMMSFTTLGLWILSLPLSPVPGS